MAISCWLVTHEGVLYVNDTVVYNKWRCLSVYVCERMCLFMHVHSLALAGALLQDS